VPAQAQYSGGSGTADEPYQIATAEDLILLGETPNDYDKHFKLTADIDLSRYTYDRAVIAPDMNDAKSGFDGTPFTGVFEGNDHVIWRLTIVGEGYLGLFGRLESEATVSNLGLEAVDVSGMGYHVGGLVGSNWESSITNSYSTGTVTGGDCVGGLVGSIYRGGSITASYSTGAVTGGRFVGGLVGSQGFLFEARVADCFSNSTVTGGYCVGGLVGVNESGSITNSYSTGTVSGTEAVGGLVGGGNPDRVSRSFWDIHTSGLTDSDGGTGLTTAEMQTASNFLEAGWDFVDETENGTEDIWWIDEGQDYPRLWSVVWAASPNPQAGATGVIPTGTLRWRGTPWAVEYDVYFGEEEPAVANATTDSEAIYVGRYAAETTTYEPGDLGLGVTYYWRVDEVEADSNIVWKGPVWSFTVMDAIGSPDPADGASDVILPIKLSWVPGVAGLQYDVYIGQDKDTVVNATPASLDVYLARQRSDTTTFAPGDLECSRTYYWRIDGVDEADPSSVWEGNVWSFTTSDFILLVTTVDDFEIGGYSANIATLRLYFHWRASSGTGSLAGPFLQQDIVHGGRRSMVMTYSNVDPPHYSEAARTWQTPQDWTIEGADTVTLYFRGRVDNGPDPLYVVIEDEAGRMKVVTHPDANAVLATEWQACHISLADLQAAGVDVASVKKMIIGVGDRESPQPAGMGWIYVDDIAVTKRAP
jgi:hypothetical protein